MNKKLTLELPQDTLCCFVNYVYCGSSGLLMGTTAIDGDDLMNGEAICKGADGYDKEN